MGPFICLVVVNHLTLQSVVLFQCMKLALITALHQQEVMDQK